ncbi:SDR family NAD(P)-dependent oxidoreductase [Acuticoccus mangrovi]|uniref:SDR family oxidoreductase n=1 Tax=Acuticoccus mangrovi TaxID=2796142 RepID=A0A934IP47_9HYPH|nr:SDR family oxidoreductase [Acuticoccus mangrovi]MBJ3775973.1 SDR family oxidoreductase [Acuticoccus mangrovi]
MVMLPGIADKATLVTGSSRGIGYAVAEAFVTAGAKVTLLAETQEVVDAARRLEEAHGTDVGSIVCDVREAASVAGALRRFGPLDILVNNAGLERETRLDDPSAVAMVSTIMDINVTGMFRVTHAMLPMMKPGGVIVNTASEWGRYAPGGYSAYAASKHAVIGLTRSWSRELAESGIRVNAVCPGWVGTEPAMRTLRTMAERRGVTEAEMTAEIEAGQDIKGVMEPADVAGLYLFLASDLAANITGQAVHVDRGKFQA